MGIIWRGIIHDMSKFSISEFKPYAFYFFGKLPYWDEVKKVMPAYCYSYTKDYWKDKFDLAWLHHKRINKHHWEYWVDVDEDRKITILKMPEVYAKEMLCDWRGAGKAINGFDETKSWYEKNKNQMLLHSETRAWIEEQLSK